jgi:hypothetical protein
MIGSFKLLMKLSNDCADACRHVRHRKEATVMTTTYTLTLDQDQIRFTPAGKIAVIDAIDALIDSESAEKVWMRLIAANPEILNYCKGYHFRKDRVAPVVDGAGWEKIEPLLFEYLVDTTL